MMVNETPQKAARRLFSKKLNEGFKPEALHTYKTVDGDSIYWRVRMKNPNTGEKFIRPLSLKNGIYVLKEPEFTEGKPLYNLDLLSKNLNETVFIVEGEKCADALVKMGLVATTSGGATSAGDANWEPLVNRDVLIWSDNDSAGFQYASDVSDRLSRLGCNIKFIDVAELNLQEKADCVDWLNSFEILHKRLADKKDVESLKLRVLDENYGQQEISLICASSLKPEAISWLWDGWIAKGKLHILAGTAGTGKTTIAISLASIITRGGEFPDGTKSQLGSVLIWSGEDSATDTLIPRLIAVGADLNRIHFVGDVSANYEKRSFDPAKDMHQLMIKASRIQDLAMLVIDPIVNAVAGDSHKNGEVRRALQPIVEFGEKLNCAVVGITHFSKGGQGKDPLERVTGSLAFGALARIVLATAKINVNEKTSRVLCRAKSNIGKDEGGFEYDIQQTELSEYEGVVASYVLWGEGLSGAAKDLLAEPSINDSFNGSKSALEDAESFLLQILAEGPVSNNEIREDARGAGHAWRTVERAKKKLDIRSSKSHLDGKWYWHLSSNTAKYEQHRQDSQTNDLAALADFKFD